MTESPERAEPLRLPPRGQGLTNTFWVLFGVVALGAILVACAVYTAPPLMTDWQVREAARPAANTWVSDGKCSAKLVIHICDMTLNLRTPDISVARRVNYVFSGLHVGDYSIAVMANPARPDLLTTDLGLDRLWNRTITQLVLVAALVTAIVGALASLIRNRRQATGALG